MLPTSTEKPPTSSAGDLSALSVEFLLCGSPNDSFYSQAAIFRCALDSFGGIYERARLVLCLGDLEVQSLPHRWASPFANIEVHWSDRDSFLEHGDGSDFLFGLINSDADLTFICDADTLLLQPFDDEFLTSLIQSPAIAGVIAHYTPPRVDRNGQALEAADGGELWKLLAQSVLGREILLPYCHTLAVVDDPCPFYINYGFVAGTPSLLKSLHAQLSVVQPAIRKLLDNDFYGQIGITLGTERGSLPVRALPMRFNFPNDPIADARYPDELEAIVLLHYLRKTNFDRHLIFAHEDAFDAFISMDLTGSEAKFQQFVTKLTGGRYPFQG